jgi:Skp family chaperone for outer membrane proteins
MARVFGEYHRTKDAEAELEKRKDEARAEVEGQDTKLKAYRDELDALRKSINDPALGSDVRAAKKKQFEAKAEEAQALRTDLLDFARRREAQLLEMFNRKRDEILEELRGAVSKKSQLAGYDLVFDKSARSTRDVPFLLYSKDAKDFSSELIDELNASK